jgi:hypothetical protein
MTDGDGSHSSERRLDTRMKCLSLNLFSLGFYFSVYFFVFYVHLLCVCFYLVVYFLTSGASSPEWVKPTAEGGRGFPFVCFCFAICSYVCFCSCFLSTRPSWLTDGKRDEINN